MRNAEQARLAALAVLAALADGRMEIQLVDDKTEVFEAGWVFWYQSASVVFDS